MGQHCTIQALSISKVHAAELLLHSISMLQEFHLLGYELGMNLINVFEEATSSLPLFRKRRDYKSLSLYMVSQLRQQISLYPLV